MPTYSSMNLPPPKSWEEFEAITLDALIIKWKNPDLVRHGRQGQTQEGVDIYGKNHNSLSAGVQCKKYDTGKLTEQMIKKEIAKAENFMPKLDVFYIATSHQTDAKLQEKVRLLSEMRENLQKFPVHIFFWEDLHQAIVQDDKILNKHYPQLSPKNYKRLFSLLDLGYYGLMLKNYCKFILYSATGDAPHEDSHKISVVCSKITNACTNTLTATDLASVNSNVDSFLSYLMPHLNGQKTTGFNWNVLDNHAERISGLVKNVEHTLNNNELLIFRIGELLCQWEVYEFDKEEEIPISVEFLKELTANVSKVDSGELVARIKNLIDQYNKDSSNIVIPSKIYLALRDFFITKITSNPYAEN